MKLRYTICSIASAVLLIGGISCNSVKQVKSFAKCQYSLGLKSEDIQPVNAIYLGDTEFSLDSQKSGFGMILGGLQALNSLTSGNQSVSIGLNMVVKNPYETKASIDAMDFALFLDRNGDGNFDDAEQLDLDVQLNAYPSKNLLEKLAKESTKNKDKVKHAKLVKPFAVNANSTEILPVVIDIPNILSYINDTALASSLLKAVTQKDLSRFQVKIRPYLWGIPSPMWITLNTDKFSDR